MLHNLDSGLSAAEGARLALVELDERACRGRGRLACARRRRRSAAAGARRLRRGRRARRARPAAVDLHARDGPARRRAALPARARRALAARRGVDRAGALRERPPARPAARPRARLGQRRLAAGAARVPPRRAARPRTDLLRARTARPGVAHHVPRARHAARHDRRDGAPAAARARRRDRDDRGPGARPRSTASPRSPDRLRSRWQAPEPGPRSPRRSAPSTSRTIPSAPRFASPPARRRDSRAPSGTPCTDRLELDRAEVARTAPCSSSSA